MRHLLPTLLFAALAAVVSARPDKADLPPALVPLTQQAFTEALASDLAGHFNLEGDLQLELLRAWTPPTQIASTWGVVVTEYPNVASTAMIVRCRVLADNAVVADPQLMVRAALWRDAWVARNPLTTGTMGFTR